MKKYRSYISPRKKNTGTAVDDTEMAGGIIYYLMSFNLIESWSRNKYQRVRTYPH